MGRAKLNIELITKEKSRNITFNRRKHGLIRKISEFSTLCDVSSCMIIYGPRTENGRGEPEIWPENPDEVKRIIGVFKSKNKDSGYKNFSVPDFFKDRNKKIDDDLAKMKKKNLESKYPTSPELMNYKSEAELREWGAALSTKYEHVKARIDFLKRSSNNQLGFNNLLDFAPLRPTTQSHSHNSAAAVGFYAPQPRGVGMDVMYQHAISSHVDHHDHGELHSVVNQNSMMMMMPLKNESDRVVQFEGASAASASVKRGQFYFESMSDVVDPLLCHNTRPFARYYNYMQSDIPPPQMPLPPFPSYMYMMPGTAVLPPQLRHFSSHEEKMG